MAVGPADTKLQGWRVCRIGEHVPIMITLEHQRVTLSESADKMRRRLAGVGQHTEPRTPVTGDILDRLTRIVRNGIRGKLKIADLEPLTVPAEVKDHAVAVLLNCLVGAETQPYRNAMAARKLEYASDMILMFVCHDDASEIPRPHIEPLQAAFCLANGKPAIQHDRRSRRAGCSGNQQCVAFTAAS